MTTAHHSVSSGRSFAHRRWRRVAVAVALSMLLIGTAATVALGSAADGGRYRTATASVQDTTETLGEVGTVEPISQVAVAFPNGGTVATVDVAVGDEVGVGDVLATLDAASLEADVRSAQADLDQAVLDLELARNGETVTGGGGEAGASVVGLSGSGAVTVDLTAQADPSSGPSASSAPSAGDSSPAGDDGTLAAAEQRVLDAQRAVDGALRLASEKLTSAQQICAALGEDADPAPASTSTSSTSTSSTSTSTTAVPDDASTAAGACYDALAAVLDAQGVTQAAQNTLADAAAALDLLRAERAATAGSDSVDTSEGNVDGGAGSDDAPTGTPASPTAQASPTPSSEDLIAHQKAIDEAELALVVAEHALDHHSIVSPIDGTIMAVGLGAGDDVDAASDTATITVAGDGGYEVTATVGVDDLPDLAIGQTVTVVPDGSTDERRGELVAIGLVGSSGTSGTAYQVTVGLTDAEGELRNGSVASIAIAIDEAVGAVSVPTSAVRVDSGDHYVLVLDGDTAERVAVEIGAVGATWTEITDGVAAGDVVVIADLDEPLPGSASDTTGAGNTGDVGGGGGRAGLGGGAFPGLPGN